MRKKTKLVLIPLAILMALWIFGRLTNMLQWYSAPTTANYPTIKNGDRFFASNLITPQRFNFICYYATTPEFGKQIWTHRLCGLEGDLIEIKNGNLFVNKVYVDTLLTLAHNYIFPSSQLKTISETEGFDESMLQRLSTDSLIMNLADKTVVTNSIQARRYTLKKEYVDELIQKQYSKPWNQDNFGPAMVPKGKYFLLGDNRLQSNDSRYIGFVDKTNFIATVIGR